MVKVLIYLLILIKGIFLINDGNINYQYVNKEINVFKNNYEFKKEKTTKVLATYYSKMTAYGPDCKGCSGITSSGYNVKKTIYYNDKEYGKIRIVAADKSLPFGSIIKISNLKNQDDIIAIVLDRGSAIGFKKKSNFDLLYPSEKETSSFGLKSATIELLRRGY